MQHVSLYEAATPPIVFLVQINMLQWSHTACAPAYFQVHPNRIKLGNILLVQHMSRPESLEKLCEWLHRKAPRDILMPLVSKRPLYPHSRGRWGWEDFDTYMAGYRVDHSVQEAPAFGLLLRDLICIDVDSHELCQHLRESQPDWFDPPPAEAITSKGRHYLWRRGESASITDRARSLVPECVPPQFRDENGEAPIDIKTVTSTGTSGVLVVSPSPGKTWATAPWDLPDLPTVPDSLLDWLDAKTKPRSDRRRRGNFGEFDGNTDNDWDIPIELPVAVALAKQIVANDLNDPDSYFSEQKQNGLYFRTGSRARVCPYGHVHNSNNFALVFRKDGSINYWCFGSVCREAYQSNPKQAGRWAGGDTFPAHARFDEPWYCSVAGPLESEMSKKLAEQDMDFIEEHSSKLIGYLNRFFIIAKSSKPEVVELRYKEEKSGQIVNFVRRSVLQHNTLYRNKKFMLNNWFAHPTRRCVDRLIFEFDRAKVKDTDFNMFLGLKVERENDVAGTQLDMSLIDPVLELLHDVWAGGQEHIYEYLLNWFAYPLKTKRKTGVCLVVISEQGYGKGTVAHDLIGQGIYGECLYDAQDGSYTQITDIEDIVGKFNTQSCNKIFINADECSSFGGAYKQNNKLKSLITANTRKLEAKGLDAINVSDFANYLLTTNNSDPVRVETSDRRFVILDINREIKKDTAFFRHLHECIGNGAPLHFYKYLMERQLPDNFDPQGHRPITEAAKQMMRAQIPTSLAFVQHCIDTKRLHIEDREADIALYKEAQEWTGPTTVKTSALYGGYCQFYIGRYADNYKKVDMAQFVSVLTKYAGVSCQRLMDGNKGLSFPAPAAVKKELATSNMYDEGGGASR